VLPVRKGYVKFDLNCLNFPGTDFVENRNVSTEPKEVGPNPNINSVIKF